MSLNSPFRNKTWDPSGDLSAPPCAASTLVELLRWRAEQQPSQLAYTFLLDGETQESRITYGELDERARAIGAALQSLGAEGERALLLFPPGLDYIAAFFGCLYARAVAVPAYPPRAGGREERRSRLDAIVNDCRPAVILGPETILSVLRTRATELSALSSARWLATDSLAPESEREWRQPPVGGETLAFLQYTSGSTATPKGVMVTHANLLHNQRLIQWCFRQEGQSVIVGWLPLYHDMGLIGNVLHPLYVNARCILMSPTAFLQQPLRWLRAISDYRATTSGGPNFAYDLCARKITDEQCETLDLSSWTTAFNGAEPVRHDTMERFAARFVPFGFRREAFSPCYGLAEATLIVTGAVGGKPPASLTLQQPALEQNQVAPDRPGAEGARTFVSSGEALLDEEVKIVDPVSATPCAAGRVGEVWVSSPSVTRGYWGRPSETEEIFGARLASGEGPFLRTGDLGFFHDGQLFVTGRLKDLIVIRGRNLYPQDIELTAEQSHSDLRPGGTAAFSVEARDEERLVVVQEVEFRRRPDAAEVIGAIRQAVAEEHEVQPYAVVLIKPGTISKTSSGKIQRSKCRAQFEAGELHVIAEWRGHEVAGEARELQSNATPSSLETRDVESWLAERLAAKLGLRASDININQPVSFYGIDSLLAVELAHETEAALGFAPPLSSFLRGASVADLAAMIMAHAAVETTAIETVETLRESDSATALSYGQKALWFLHQLTPTSAAYNLSSALRIRSTVDVAALRRAFQLLVMRHASLRTTFQARPDGEPVRRVLDHAKVCFQDEDATGWSEDELTQRLQLEAHRPFDLERGPLLRVSLFRRSPREHVLLLSLHHIVADFWSLAVLAKELGALYREQSEGTPSSLAPVRSDYGDYVRSQAELLSGTRGAQLWAYWKEQLAGAEFGLNLPTDRLRPLVQTYQGASEPFALDAELSTALKLICKEHGTTLYMLLLAAFQTLLNRHTGQKDLVVGSPVSGRDSARWAELVGYFVNPLVLRTSFRDDPTFEQLLSQVRRTVLEAFEHQGYPFPLLVERLQPERDASQSPLFQAMFVFQKAQPVDAGLAAFALGEVGPRMDLGGLSVESAGLRQRLAQFDLTLTMAEVGPGLAATLEYNTDLFDPATVRRMAGRFQTLLRAIAENPSETISELSILTDEEQRLLLFDFNDTARAYPAAVCLHQLFERQAALTPDRVALVCGSERVSYGELNERADRLAQRLGTLGVGPESRVGVLLERTAELVVTLLGVWKAGGAYVPLDAAYPRERLSFMVEDAAVCVLVTQRALLDRLPSHTVPVIDLEDGSERREANERRREIDPQNLAYLIYTSGSTGRPKAVAIEHRSAATLLHWAHESFTAAEFAGVLASTSISFDLSIFELFAPLTCGGKVILADDALALPRLAAGEEVTLINTVPSAMSELVRQGGLPGSLKVVNLAGEALKRALVEALYETAQIERVLNLYGPSEDTTYSTWCEVRRGEDVTIGRPVANTRAYVVDANLRLLPIGVPGELLLGGEGLARGYLGRPRLTAERFIPDPFGAIEGGRLYRTGDLVRILADGRLDFLGRMDHQVKVRGFRIELGEIEAALLKHESVREAVVIAREAARDDLRLVAYVSGTNGNVPPAPELRAYLKQSLPEHMVPSSFVTLERLPLTPNGKVDRKALPAPEQAAGEAELEEPRTPVEELVCGVWAEVLGVDRVGVNDNFFELGGHSLLAMRVVSRVRSLLGVEVDLQSFFIQQTPAQLAAEVEQKQRERQPRPPAPPLLPVERSRELPLSFAQRRLWFIDQLEPESAVYNIPCSVRLNGQLDAGILERSLNAIVARHDALRTSFPARDGEPVQQIHNSLELTLGLVDLTALDAAERERRVRELAHEEAALGFDVEHGPLVRGRLLRLRDDEHVLLLTMHHIVSDGWSLQVIVHELTRLYEAYRASASPRLPALSVQYADFAVWQREWLKGSVLEEQVEYWRRRLAGAPVLELPSDRPRPPAATYSGASEPFILSEELTWRLKELSRREGVTLFMTLLAGLQTLLARYTRQEDIIVGSPIAGRNRVEVERLIGFFVNTLALRTDLSGNPSVRELLRRVRETTLGAYAHQDVPFEKLVEELQPRRSLSHQPFFQVMLAFQNVPRETFAIEGLEAHGVLTPPETSKFDLSLSVGEEEGRLQGTLEYAADLYDRDRIRRLIGHLQLLLEGMAGGVEVSVFDLPLLSDDESRQLLVEFNDTAAPRPADATLHEAFDRQAMLTPERIALSWEHHALTYRGLNERASRLAHYLREHGAGPETLIGVCCHRRPELVVALLGVLKAGAAYLPLDPAYPAERLRFMIDDAAALLLLTEEALLPAVEFARLPTLCLDRDWHEVAKHPARARQSDVGAGNLAYLIYTSGSTGRPKGVAIEHGSAAELLAWAGRNYSNEELAGVLASTSICFDLSIFELFVPLSKGGTVVLADSALALADLPQSRAVTLVNTVPSAMAELVRQSHVPRSVRTVNLAGEALTRQLVNAVYEQTQTCRVVNLYGPSEDTTYSTFAEIRAQDERAPAIGLPVSNTRLYVLGQRMAPVPLGVAGEICLAGAGLARAYLNRPELTAERFVPDPHARTAGARMYRTGDLGRWRSDGEVEYMGRMDHQVKVRGFRIELGEIEAALLKHDAVREAVVVAREVATGDLRLVAYLAGANGDVPAAPALRAYLKETLPEHMVPSSFVTLERLPLTPNGKLDRKALPDPELVGGRGVDGRVGGRTAVEELVSEMWSEVLGVERIGISDNFFELGGHSLLATRLLSRISGAFGVEVALRRLFESPTVAGLAELIELEMRGASLRESPLLVPGERGEQSPLSFAQQRLWFLNQLEPESSTYNMPAAFRLKGDLNLPALEQSLGEIIRRHEVLRARFENHAGLPVQVFDPPAPISIPVVDLSGLGGQEQEAKAEAIARAEAARPFDLARGPLLRARLLRLEKHDHLLVFTIHHIVADGWSAGVLVHEMAALYEAFSSSRPAALPKLSVQYADFARWQAEWLQTGVLDEQIGYWKQQLSGRLPVLELPTDRPRPPVRTFRGARLTVALSPEVVGALKALSRREGVTLYVVLLAAFKVLLSRYTGETDIIVGAPFVGRRRTEVEGLIGFFANTLALRTELSGEPTFRELLAREREVFLEAYAHQDVPFEKLVEVLQPERSLEHLPLFQVMLAMEEPLEVRGLAGLEVSTQEVDSGTARFDLTVWTREGPQGLTTIWEYDADLFDAATVKRMGHNFRSLLESIAECADKRLPELDVLTDEERRLLLFDFNDTARAFPAAVCLHQLFERQAALTPDRVALVCGSERVSYGELNERADRLAHRLGTLGVGPESRVGVLLGRTAELVVTLLGVWKAGGAYVPLDAAYPRERLSFMVEDAAVCVLVTQRALLDRLPSHTVPVIDLEDSSERRETNERRGEIDPQNLAYLIYTSGSTGRPKAVAIEHRSAATLLHWAHESFTAAEFAGVLASTSISFDLSIFELFAPLTCGGKVILADDALALPRLPAGAEVTLINTVPSAMSELVRQGGLPASLKVVNLAGEALKQSLVEALYETAQVERVLNLYGPSEDTTYSTWCEVRRGEDVTIGRPVANTRAYVVDANLRLMPLGVPGELLLGGEGLARGYLGRPRLTAERFIPDPFGAIEGGRLYRTGDLVRILADGRLDFLGRMDHQVKVRGFRIELGEIEAALLKHESVREAVVIAREAARDDLRLVAYLSGANGNVPPAPELRAYLKQSLPEHMVPSSFVTLERLPLTPNGKVDRKALPDPEQSRSDVGASYVGPRNQLEKMLAGIWSEVLGTERVGVEDNFFALGGHSLLATRVVSRVREALGVELPVREMFQTPTVAELARAVESARGTDAGLHAPPLVKVSRDEPPVTSFAQERLWFLEQLEPGNPFYNVATAVRLHGSLDVAALERALNEVARRHETLRTTFESVDGRAVQVIAPEPGLRVEFEDLSSASDEAELEAAVRRRVTEEATRPFDLARGPLFRCCLLELREDEHVLVVCIHHIISDGWSIEVLIRETGALYEAYSRGAESPLAELEFQYRDYAAWQRGWMSGAQWDAHLAHWRERLAGAPAVLELPGDHPRPAEPSYRGARRSFYLGEELTRGLRELSKREGVTTYMLLLAAFKTLLHRYSGQTDIVVGTPVANRGRLELEGLIGFFLNTLALRTDLSGDPTFAELLSRVREVTLDGFAYQEFPFEKLVEELQPERSLSHAPLFQVMFTHQTLPPLRDVGGLWAEAMQLDNSTSKFDLTLAVLEDETDLRVEIEYSTDIFGAGRIERMEGHFTRLLREASADAGRRISQLEILSEAEREQITHVWNDTARETSSAQNVVDLFEQQARMTPDAPAVICDAEQISYGQLNAWSNQLAHHLRRLGVVADSLVGVCMERSIDMVAAVVAVFKAGAAYVPLDPAYPPQRLSFMLEESCADVVLTQQKLLDALQQHGGKVVCLDADRAAIETEDDGDPPRHAHLDNLGYVIYTSGSTGRPKGIGLPQRALLNLIEWHLGSMKTGARTLQFASLSFDASFHEIFAALCSGGAVVVATEEERKEVRRLAELLKRQRVEKAILPVIVAQQLAEECEGEERDFSELTEVTTTGEQLQVTAGMIRMFKRMSWSGLNNHYGPSETHVVTAYKLPVEPDEWVSYPPMGRPLWNTSMYVLDAQMKPTPVGVPGELYIGGVMLARGYLKRPDLTAEKFIPDPFSRCGGERLYRTGDLARYLEDGNIEYLGRIDQQVKIRGFRVELEEIEAVLRRCEGVTEAAVQAVPDVRGGKRLVGYIAGGEVSTDTLIRSLRESLPDYMVPALYVKLDHLPLTPNGKLDRRALPVPDDKRDAERPFVAPRTGTEELLAGIWGRVLRRGDVGVRDNFFELGGHSLLATQVVSRIREAFGVELELRSLFDGPTIEALAREVERLAGAGPSHHTPPLARVERDGPLPLSFAQQRLWFFDQLEPGSPLYHVPIRLKLTGRLNVVALGQTLDEIVRRHEPLRTVFASEKGSPVQVVKPPEPVLLSLTDLTRLPEELKRREASKAAAREAARPFDLARGPLLRVRLIKLDDSEHVALLTMHHIVSDGWTLGVLVREVGALYGALTSGAQSPFPELEVQYADYAVWQRRWLEGEPLEEQTAYWTRQLAGAPQSLELPTDRPRSAVRGYAGAHRRFRLRAETAEALKALCEREGVTLFMALVAAFKAFLSRHSNQDDIVVGTDIANRHHARTEGLIGFFVNQLVLRTKLSDDPTFVELLKRVRSVALGAYAHQDMPFDKLVEVLNPGRGTGRTPLFQAKLVLQNTPVEPLELPGLKLEPLEDEIETGTSRFDLMLTFIEDSAGLSGVMEYSTELFEAATAARLLGSFEKLLESAVARPDARLGSLEIMTEEEAAERAVQKKRREASGIQRLKAIKPKTLSLSRQQFLKTRPLRPDAALPLLVEPNVDGVDLARVIGGSRELIEQWLSKHGALLFRGFNVSTQADFEEFLRATPYQLMRYMEGATPRTELSEKVYTSTEYPPDQHIALHNELTYVTQWPMKIWFFCQQQPAAGGETPIADVRGVYKRIPPRIRDRFVEKGWMLTRNFGQGLSLPWQASFHTEQAAEVENYCRGARIEWEWRPGGGLRTRQTRPAVAQHPETRELVWFNHVAFWHVSSLEASVSEAMLKMFREEDLPYNTYYGDGTPIEDSVVAEIREAYRQERLEFPWRAGDILMLDNMLVAHGRNPYSPPRRVLVAMA